MAKNFQIDTRVDSRKNLRVKLAGDFDGTSACELLNVLREKAAKYSRVTVETQELKSVESFGLQIVASRIPKRSPGGAKIGFTGKYRSAFCLE
jgi:anti-anti-sigma regulatory factor